MKRSATLYISPSREAVGLYRRASGLTLGSAVPNADGSRLHAALCRGEVENAFAPAGRGGHGHPAAAALGYPAAEVVDKFGVYWYICTHE